jgi:aspartate carbamoyltransferase catalytic subunit
VEKPLSVCPLHEVEKFYFCSLMSLSSPHLLGIKDLQQSDISLILHTAKQFKDVLQRPVKKVPSLRDVTIVNLFYENSTRTRISFELAEKRLSADTINFSASGSSVSKGETLLDTVNNILSMKVDMVVMRHSASGAPHFLAKHINAAIINAGDGINEHPTQALLDAFSIQERLGGLAGIKVAIIGDIMHSRVALSNIYLLTRMGAEVMVAGPPTLIPIHIQQAMGVQVTYKVEEALRWCDVANVLRIQLERQNQVLFSSLREYNIAYGVKRKMLDRLPQPIVIMHPGPINRGVELDSDVANSGHSIILDQVENGVAVRMAVLYLLSGRNN